MISIVFEGVVSPLPKQYPSGMNWNEGEMHSSELLHEEDENEDEDEKFYTPKEVTPRNEIPDLGIEMIFENAEKTDTTNMPDLEREESAEQRCQEGKGLKTLTPYQMLSRLPMSLAQLQVEDNSGKLKTNIRQLLYLLYRSNKLTKTVYKNLIITV